MTTTSILLWMLIYVCKKLNGKKGYSFSLNFYGIKVFVFSRHLKGGIYFSGYQIYALKNR